MKTPLKFFLAAFVSFALILSVISTKEARAEQVQECVSSVPKIESLPYGNEFCYCHGERIAKIECVTYYGIHNWCYGTFCED